MPNSGKDCFFGDVQTPRNDFNSFNRDSAKYQIDKFSKVTNWVKLKNKQPHSKVLLNSFPMNGHTLGFCLSIESKVRKL